MPSLPSGSIDGDRLIWDGVVRAWFAKPQPTQVNVSGSRSFNSVYRNTTKRPMLLLITAGVFPTVAQEAVVSLQVGPSASMLGEVTRLHLFVGGAASFEFGGLTAFIPPNYYYTLQNAGNPSGNNQIETWFEITF